LVTIKYLGDEQLGYDAYGWGYGETDFILSLERNGGHVRVYSNQDPTIGDLLRCYGDPEYYVLKRGSPSHFFNWVFMTIYYPNHGLIFPDHDAGWRASLRYCTTSVLRHASIVPPGTPEEMLVDLLEGYDDNPELLAEELADLKEWPDDFTEVVLDE
jgi:hypothetical protein